ncbi:acyl carrier protein [Falsiroseomonas sp. E2-1-a20]|uniref:acyl carrier protein n=1 Tax=Falsiroseomonas sp. E2-1-a20 TaxID=3239300 RepID=UPI003F35EB93
MIERLKLLVSDVLEIDPAEVDAAAGREGLAAWDSLAHLRIIGAVEEEFGVRFTMQEIGEIASLGDIERSIVRHAA